MTDLEDCANVRMMRSVPSLSWVSSPNNSVRSVPRPTSVYKEEAHPAARRGARIWTYGDGARRVRSPPGGELSWAFLGSWKQKVMLRVRWWLPSWGQHTDFGLWRVERRQGEHGWEKITMEWGVGAWDRSFLWVDACRQATEAKF